MSASYETRFAKKLKEKLDLDLEDARDRLSSGAMLVSGDAGSIGVNCAKLIGHIHGIVFAMNCIELVEEEMFSKPKDKKESAV